MDSFYSKIPVRTSKSLFSLDSQEILIPCIHCDMSLAFHAANSLLGGSWTLPGDRNSCFIEVLHLCAMERRWNQIASVGAYVVCGQQSNGQLTGQEKPAGASSLAPSHQDQHTAKFRQSFIVSPCLLFYMVPGNESRASSMLSKCSTTGLHPIQPCIQFPFPF